MRSPIVFMNVLMHELCAHDIYIFLCIKVDYFNTIIITIFQ